VSGWPAANEKPILSRGHGTGELTLVVRTDPASRERYLAMQRDVEWPTGTLIAAFHRDKKNGRPGPIYVIERRTNGWAYLAFDAEGRPAEPGTLGLCQRCHEEAPSGALFGLPRELPPRE
jgi:hypothetical protein